MDLDEYSRQSKVTDQLYKVTKDFEPHILGLTGDVGDLAETWRLWLRERENFTGFHARVKEQLGDILWYVAAIARRIGVPLSEIATSNLERTQARWNPEPGTYELYDEAYPPEQQLPRNLRLAFHAHDATEDGEVVPHVSLNRVTDGNQVGDMLNDNSYYDDGYRFHDAFHLSYVANLGWSPNVRSLLKRKRKQNVGVDRVEDGARAIFTEEGIAAYVFMRAQSEWNYFRDVETVDADIIKYVRAAVRGLEVETRSPSDWERAILNGFGVWRNLRDNNGGVVEVDMMGRTLTFVGPAASPGEGDQ